MVKKCNKCKEVKDVSMFGIEARAKNGFKPRCKECTNLYYRQKYSTFRDNKLAQMKERSKNDPDFVARKKAQWEKYREANKERLNAKNKLWRPKDIDLHRKQRCEYIKKLTNESEEYRMKRLMRAMLYRLKIYKNTKTATMLGYTYTDLINHLGRVPTRKEAIDHKIPTTWFEDMSDYKTINSLENLQILTRSENSKKNNYYADPVSLEFYNEVIGKIKQQYKEKVLWKQNKHIGV